MSRLLYAIPVLGRPARAAPVVASARTAVPDARILFLCSRGDLAEQRAARATGADVRIVPWRAGPADWARKLNLAIREEAEEWMLLGADDLTFHPGWFEACLRANARTGACVVGTNDLGNQRTMRGSHSTHPLVHRDYLECGTIDEAGKILHEGYTHMFSDDEFVQTASGRGTYVHAFDAHVEHLHPIWGKGEHDATYARGEAGFWADKALYEERCSMWLPGRARALARRGRRY